MMFFQNRNNGHYRYYLSIIFSMYIIRFSQQYSTFKSVGLFVIPLYFCQLDLLASFWVKYSFEFCPCQRG